MTWFEPNRWDATRSRADSARILRGLRRMPSGGDDGEEPGPPWYRNPWVWVSIVVIALVLIWLIAVFT